MLERENTQKDKANA